MMDRKVKNESRVNTEHMQKDSGTRGEVRERRLKMRREKKEIKNHGKSI